MNPEVQPAAPEVIGVGVDLVENRRMQDALAKWGDSLLNRLFTTAEIAYCEKQAAPWRHYAGRFALKEAVAKAFGTGIGQAVHWRDIEVIRSSAGAPQIRLHGRAARHARSRGVRRILVSLAHTHQYSLAQAVILGHTAISARERQS